MGGGRGGEVGFEVGEGEDRGVDSRWGIEKGV